MDRTSQSRRPEGRPAGFQRWRTLLFLHWEVPVDAVARLLPRGLDVDTFEGKAYVGVVPFTMRDVAPAWAPPVPGVSDFHELNVRTYVHLGGKDPAVWFFSLDAASSVAVVAARAGWHLPYHRASMELHVDGDEVRYRSRRLWPGPKPAELTCRYRIGGALPKSVDGTFQHFVAERYLLVADTGGGDLRVGQVHHKPYPLREATVLELEQSMVEAAGLPKPAGAPHAVFSEGVDVDIYALRKPA
ncbi:MAG TPA: DUF2071 domain-containing protein [Minicystis sp.]|nr:DUF2071 domain-containing protein [Minicystis sp.]